MMDFKAVHRKIFGNGFLITNAPGIVQSWTKGFQHFKTNCRIHVSVVLYFQYLKFGFGRCWRDSSRHIQLNKLNKKTALNYIKKYDGELDEKDLSKTIEFLKISRLEFYEYVEKHRNESIWIKSGNKFQLKK